MNSSSTPRQPPSRNFAGYGVAVGTILVALLLRDRIGTGEMNPAVALALASSGGFLLGVISKVWGEALWKAVTKWPRRLG